MSPKPIASPLPPRKSPVREETWHVPPSKPNAATAGLARTQSTPAQRAFAKRSPRRSGPSGEYTPDRQGNNFALAMADDIEALFLKAVWRGDPRKIIRGLSKQTGATEESIARVLYSRLLQYRAETRAFRSRIEGMRGYLVELIADVDAAGRAVWERKSA